MLFWPKKKKAKALFEAGLKAKGIDDRLDVPVAIMIPMVSMMWADKTCHLAELDCIHAICTSSPIFLRPSRSHIDGWIAEAEKFIREYCGNDETACRRANEVLTKPLRETAYAFAVKVLFADEKVTETEKLRANQLADWLQVDHSLASDIVKVISILRHGRDG